jgi:hypothetical protein
LNVKREPAFTNIIVIWIVFFLLFRAVGSIAFGFIFDRTSHRIFERKVFLLEPGTIYEIQGNPAARPVRDFAIASQSSD